MAMEPSSFYRTESTRYQGHAPRETPFGNNTEISWANPNKTVEYEHVNKDGVLDARTAVDYHGARGRTMMPPKEMTQPGPDTGGWSGTTLNWPAIEPGQLRGQLKLFEHRSSQASATVDTMMSTKAGRLPNMTALGMAAADAHSEGLALTPSNDLSKHSHRLVNRLAEGGHTSPSDGVTNKIGFANEDDMASYTLSGSAQKMSPNQVASGRRTIRSVVGRNSKGQGYQPPLPI